MAGTVAFDGSALAGAPLDAFVALLLDLVSGSSSKGESRYGDYRKMSKMRQVRG